jgi:hypothetical protein
MNVVDESKHTQSLMQFLSSFDLSTESQVSQLLHYHNPNCRTPAQSFESLYLLARTQSCKMMTMKKKKNTAEFFPHRDNDQENKTHQKKKKKTKQKNKKTKVRAVPENCPDRHTDIQTDRHTDIVNVTTLALGSRLRQRELQGCGPKGSPRVNQEEARELSQEEARESHHILPGMQESARKCEKVLESVRE